MKKYFALVMALVLLMLFISCKTTEDTQETVVAAQPKAVAEEPPAEEPAVEEETLDTSKGYLEIDLLKGVIPGVLYQLNLVEGQEPIVKAVSLAGNQAGTKINEREPSIENIRFVFEMDEWVSVIVDSEVKDNLMVFAVPHVENPAVYDDQYFEAIPDNMVFVGLNDPDEAGSEWGAFYLNPDFNKDGFYDLVFTDGISPVAMVLVKFYEAKTITEISDAELEKFMDEAAKEAKNL